MERKREDSSVKVEEIRTDVYELKLKNGTLISVRILRDVDELNLSNLGIKKIEDQVFENVKRVKILNLQSNNIDQLGSGTFSRLGEVLDELNIGSSKIDEIKSRPFVGLVNLKLLNFSHNPAEYLEEGAFFGVPKTADIVVHNNQLQGLCANLFENMAAETIQTAENQTPKDSPVDKTELNKMEIAVKSEDFVRQKATFPQNDETQFSKTQFSCRGMVDISPELLNNLPETVKTVDLSNNRIEEIKNDVMKNAHIGVLDLIENRIETIRDRAFESLSSLWSLWLTDNKIREISFAASLPTNLEELHLTENKILQIPDGAFSRLSNLRELHLEDNNISVIHSGAFDGLKSLTLLDLSDNQITEIESNSFVGIPKYCLSLNGNRISKISPGSINIENLVNLHLENNLLTDMNEETFRGLPGLNNLHLEGNKISEISPGAMKHLNALSRLDISKNPLVELRNGTLFGLPKTQEACMVFVADNKLGLIQGGVFDDL